MSEQRAKYYVTIKKDKTAMKNRMIRFPDDIWNEAKAKAKAEKTQLSKVVRTLVYLWIDGRIDIEISEE